MAKRKNSAPAPDEGDFSVDLFSEIAQKTGGDVISKTASARYYIDTGSLAINRVCSGRYIHGGIPGGKITEIYGPSSTAKSLIASNCLFGTQKLKGYPILLDVENASNPIFMKTASHLDIDRVIRYTPETLEACFQKMYTVIKMIRARVKDLSVPITIVYDSISVSPPAREYRETELQEGYSKEDFKRIVGAKEQPGERARICSKEFRKVTPLLEESNTALLVLNQTRQKIGVLYGDPTTTGGGGNALPFYASCRLRTSPAKQIDHAKLDKAIGVNIKLKNVKNRSCAPFLKTEGVQLLFEHGINPISGILNLLVADERVVMTSAGRYTVSPEFAADKDKEYKFQAAKSDNTVPVEVILDNPKLVDAESREEVEEYLRPFQAAMNVLKDENVKEKVVTDAEEMETSDEYDKAGVTDDGE
jgi:recombination protein RecA